ncbi:MAG: hypothetical protein Fur0037_06730 [Planctomycetota bacterium]
MKRPSHYLLLFSVLFVAGYLFVDVRTGAETRPAVGAASPRPSAPASDRRVVAHSRAPRKETAAETLRGLVYGPTGFSIVGAELAFATGEKARTDADGRFSIDLRTPPPWEIAVTAEGFAGRRVRAYPCGEDPLLLALDVPVPWGDCASEAANGAAEQPASLIGDGFVLGANGQPVEGALVAVGGTEIRARTDSIGHYRVPLPGEGVSLVATHPASGTCGRSRSIPAAGRSGMIPLPEIVLEPGSTIRGTVRDPRGNPLAGVPIRLEGQGLSRSLVSGRDGIFRVQGLLAGSYRVAAMAWRGLFGDRKDLSVEEPVVDCDLHLASPQPRRFRVVDEQGRPLPRAYVAVHVAGRRSDLQRTDEQGWTEVAAIDGAAFEVRGDDLREWAVRSGSADLLVVALP